MSSERSHKRLLLKLLCAVLVMFAFTYAMVPLYDTMCRVVGLNGKTAGGRVRVNPALAVDMSRTVRVEFVTQNNQAMPWVFHGERASIDVHPGEATRVMFYAKNTTGQDMVGQSIPSVTPPQAAQYLKKTECFCFNNQPLRAGQEEWMPLVFYIDPKIPSDVQVMTLSYTLFDITQRLKGE